MPVHKTSIAIDDELLAQIDEVARERGESRNRFVVFVLRRAVRARRDARITRRLDELFAGEDLQREQLRVAEELEASASYGEGDTW